eukprot:2587900-Pyramimonas_sp.AAC.1
MNWPGPRRAQVSEFSGTSSKVFMMLSTQKLLGSTGVLVFSGSITSRSLALPRAPSRPPPRCIKGAGPEGNEIGSSADFCFAVHGAR